MGQSVRTFIRLMLASGVAALVGFAVLVTRRTGYFELLLLFWLGVVCLAAARLGLLLRFLFRLPAKD